MSVRVLRNMASGVVYPGANELANPAGTAGQVSIMTIDPTGGYRNYQFHFAHLLPCAENESNF